MPNKETSSNSSNSSSSSSSSNSSPPDTRNHIATMPQDIIRNAILTGIFSPVDAANLGKADSKMVETMGNLPAKAVVGARVADFRQTHKAIMEQADVTHQELLQHIHATKNLMTQISNEPGVKKYLHKIKLEHVNELKQMRRSTGVKYQEAKRLANP